LVFHRILQKIILYAAVDNKQRFTKKGD